jgi:carboxypeptidase C (cathepsin A)
MILIIFVSLIFPKPFLAQSKFRVGTYDSRVVAVAYFNSGYSRNIMQTLKELNVKMQKAKQENDSAMIKQLNFEGPTRQAMLHEKGFGTGSVRFEMMEIKDKIDSLAKAEKIDLVVSKWELNYSNANCEVIDITEKIAALFKPNERVKNILHEILKSEPIKDAYLIQD